MKTLSVVGTAAMFMVGGGILTHGIPGAHEWIERIAHGAGSFLGAVLPTLLDALVGVIAGAILVAVVVAVTKLLRPAKPHA